MYMDRKRKQYAERVDIVSGYVDKKGKKYSDKVDKKVDRLVDNIIKESGSSVKDKIKKGLGK